MKKKNILEALKENFFEEIDSWRCGECGKEKFWIQNGTNKKFCSSCKPPPLESMVAPTAPTANQSVQSIIRVTCCQPWCLACSGMIGEEVTLVDGSMSTHCVSCSAELPDWPKSADELSFLHGQKENKARTPKRPESEGSVQHATIS